MKNNRRLRLVIVCIAMISVCKVEAQPERRAGNKRVRHPTETPSSESPGSAKEGIRFKEPLIEECMEVLRTGDADGGVKKLKDAHSFAKRNHSIEQCREFSLGLGMLYVRSGKPDKARTQLVSLANQKVDAFTAARAGVMLRVAKRIRSGDESLIAIETWSTALVTVAVQISKDLENEHKAIQKLIKNQNWKQIQARVDKAAGFLAQVAVVGLESSADLEIKTARIHMESLAHEVELTNNQIETDLREVRRLHNFIQRAAANQRRFNFVPQEVERYNYLCDKVATMWESGKALVTEYDRTANHYGDRVPLDPRVRMRLEHADLPQRSNWPP